MHNNIGVAPKPNLRVLCCRELYFFKYAFSLITLNKSHNKSPKCLAYDTFDPKHCLHPYLPCLSCARRHLLKNCSIMIA